MVLFFRKEQAMTLRQIDFFLAVCKEGSITKAAEIVHVSAPPLSRALAQLEDELGVELFCRGKTGMELTAAGKIFRTGVQEVSDRLRQVQTKIYEHKIGLIDTIRIGSINAISSRILPFRISQFKKDYPNISVVVMEESTPQLALRLEQKELDICILREPFGLSKNEYAYAPLYDEALVSQGMDQDYFYAIGKRSFFQTSRDDENEISLSTMKGVPLVIHNRYVPMLVGQCAKFKFSPDIVFKNNEVTSLLSWARAGLGVAVIPYSSTLLLGCDSLCKKKIVHPSITSQAYVVWSKLSTPSSAATAMINLLRYP